jgi:hypothetical protein
MYPVQTSFVCKLRKPQPQTLDLHLMVRSRGEELFHLNSLTNAFADQNTPNLTPRTPRRRHAVREKQFVSPAAAPRAPR